MPPMPPRPLPPPPVPPDSQGIAWAAIPFLTCGFGTPFSFAYAAVKARRPSLAVSAGGYGLGSLLVFALIGQGGVASGLAAVLMMFLWIAGTVHAFAVRPSAFPRTSPRDRANQHAIHVAQYRRQLRQEARELAISDPALAHELCIGRPDLPRAYDDGGLIDVNHAPPPVLAMLPGLTPELVKKVVEVRREQGAFVSAEELAIHADLPPELVPRLKEYTLFLP